MGRFAAAVGAGLSGCRREAAGPVALAMLRRKPTRLELKLDDIEEFESIRKDLEVRRVETGPPRPGPPAVRGASRGAPPPCGGEKDKSADDTKRGE